MSTEEERGSFEQGIVIGLAISALAIHLVVSALNSGYLGMYRDLVGPDGSLSLPLLTRVTLSVGWKVGVGVVGGAAIGALIVRRPRGFALYIAVAVMLAVAATMTLWYPQAPIYELAGKIQ